MNNIGAIKLQNKRTLTEILGAKNPLEFYVTKQYKDFEDDDSDNPDQYFGIEGLMIFNGDIDNSWNFAVNIYGDGTLWMDVNSGVYEDELKAFLEEFKLGNDFYNNFNKQ